MVRGVETGSATIEMIAWLPILLCVLAAIVQFGLYFNARNAVQAASFEAARQAALAEDPNAAMRVVYEYANGVLPGWTEGGRVSATVAAPRPSLPGDAVEVRVSYDVPILLGGIMDKAGEASFLTVRGSSTMTVEERP
jgi:hypothetical protein